MLGLIFGPPGSGKGTQAKRMQAEFGLVHLSTGAMLRAEAALGTPLGRSVQADMPAGRLVPDRLLVRLIRQRLAGLGEADGVLLDGFPRTVAQARALDRLLGEEGRRVDCVIALQAPEPMLVARLLRRAALEGRGDDTPAAIANRMEEYRARTEPVLDHYRAAGTPVFVVAASGSEAAVFERVRAALRRSGRASPTPRPGRRPAPERPSASSRARSPS